MNIKIKIISTDDDNLELRLESGPEDWMQIPLEEHQTDSIREWVTRQVFNETEPF